MTKGCKTPEIKLTKHVHRQTQARMLRLHVLSSLKIYVTTLLDIKHKRSPAVQSDDRVPTLVEQPLAQTCSRPHQMIDHQGSHKCYFYFGSDTKCCSELTNSLQYRLSTIVASYGGVPPFQHPRQSHRHSLSLSRTSICCCCCC